MLDLSFSASRPSTALPPLPGLVPDLGLPFALTAAPERQRVASGEARPVILARAATLSEAMAAAITHAEDLNHGAAPQMLAILDRDERLVLAGSASDGAVAWCHPVRSAVDARGVVMEASQLRAEARRALDWHEAGLATRLRHRAELLEARLVDPLWRSFAARALDLAA
ncbi:DNA repair protein RadC [Stagnihabitans tardus]|uniref:DNA repair protein RadC n=1 Tax=Stagnihabitans tardus TaxID=2699202 RepID=A0AAE4YAY5_9RHOB|nr:DNA repair protein RadC [Stagnihabitans tardus]NBZ89233.1 DNA repair protein RadC [Stagnihabitans tardus]